MLIVDGVLWRGEQWLGRDRWVKIITTGIGGIDRKLKMDPCMQFSFVIKFPPGHLHHKEPIKICFEDEGIASEWQVSLTEIYPTTPTTSHCVLAQNRAN